MEGEVLFASCPDHRGEATAPQLVQSPSVEDSPEHHYGAYHTNQSEDRSN